jgi:hypothetical protein
MRSRQLFNSSFGGDLWQGVLFWFISLKKKQAREQHAWQHGIVAVALFSSLVTCRDVDVASTRSNTVHTCTILVLVRSVLLCAQR